MKKTLLALAGLILTINGFSQNSDAIYFDSLSNELGSQYMVSDGQDFYLMKQLVMNGYKGCLWKRNAAGQDVWNKQFDSSAVFGGLNSMSYVNGGLLISGGAVVPQSSRGVSFIRVNNNGGIDWANAVIYGDVTQITNELGNNAGYYQTGFRDFPTGSGYTFDIVISRFSTAGNFLWGKAYGDNGNNYSNTASALMGDNGLIVAGTKAIPSATNNLMTYSRFDSAGNQLWMKNFSIPSFFTSFDPKFIYNDNDSAIVIGCAANNINNNADVLLVKIDSDGNIIWTKRYYRIGYGEYPISMIQDANGNHVILARYSNQTTTSDRGTFLLKIDRAGNVIQRNAISIPWTIGTNDYPDLLATNSGYVFSGLYYDAPSFTSFPAILSPDTNFALTCSAYNTTYPVNIETPNVTLGVESSLQVDNITAVPLTLTLSDVNPFSISDICSTTSVDELSLIQEVYPNPVSAYLSFYSTGNGFYELMDLSGRVIAKHQIFTGENKVDVSYLSSGVYLLTSGSKSFKIIKS